MKQKERQIFELNILVGLPGSGKTYFAENNYKKPEWSHNGKFIIDIEKYKDYPLEEAVNIACDNSDMKYYCGELFGTSPDNIMHACIDGLFTTKQIIRKLIIYLIKYINTNCAKQQFIDSSDYTIHINIHQWNNDIEACIHNDKMRVKFGQREQSSESTIKNTTYDIINKDELKYFIYDILHVSNINIIKHKVKYVNNYDIMFKPLIGKDRNRCYGGHVYNHNVTSKTKYMYSDEWSGGGDWANCWGGGGNISPDSPLNFDKFDKLMEKICPNISFLQYKNIYNQCVDTEETYEYDYYGGCETKIRWRCDMEKLYKILKSLNLINDNN